MYKHPIFSREYEIHVLDTYFDQYASFVSLVAYMQETAFHHIEALEMGMNDIQNKNITWFLTRIKIGVNKYPIWRDRIRVDTWSPCIDRLYAHREFRIADTSDNTLAMASGKYILFDIHNNRPLATKTILSDYDQILEDRNFPELSGKLFLKEATKHATSILVTLDHIDSNHHANNIHYITWILNSIPPEFQSTHYPEVLDIYYMGSGLLGEKLDIFNSDTKQLEDKKVMMEHCIRNSGTDTELVRAISTWLPRNSVFSF